MEYAEEGLKHTYLKTTGYFKTHMNPEQLFREIEEIENQGWTFVLAEKNDRTGEHMLFFRKLKE